MRTEADRKYYEKNKARRKADSLAYRLETRKIVSRMKAQSGCLICGEKDPRCLDFHHRDPQYKSFEVSNGIKVGLARARVLEETLKCDVLCSNCHRKQHLALVI